MFTTFSTQLNSVTTPRSQGPGSRAPPKISKDKRRKVTRACDYCRLNRIRCDDGQPCRNCHNRGEKCTNSMPWETHSLPAAKREIERLQERLGEFKNQTQETPSMLTPSDTPIALNEEKFNGRRESANRALGETQQMVDEHERDNSLSPSCTIPPFIRRMGQYIEHTSNQPYPVFCLEPTGPSLEHVALAPESRNGTRPELSRAKERHLLSLFWQGFYFLYPILDEDEVQVHYDSLWSETSGVRYTSSTRRPSALVDILLALSMQFSSSFLLRDGSGSERQAANPRAVDSSLAGQQLYNRSHRLLLEGQQNPTLRLVQSSIFSAVYLLNAGSLNLANTTLAMTVRMVHILSLHEDSAFIDVSPKQCKLRRSLWRMLIALDGYLAITMGLAPLIPQPNLTCSLRINFLPSTSVVPSKNDNNQSDIWENFHVHHTKLIMAVQSVQTLFRSKQMELLQRSNESNIYSRPTILESIACFIVQEMKIVTEWVESVPPDLKVPRENGGSPFFFLDGPILKFNPYAPIWLQRQQLILEITYNHLNLAVLRPFVHFRHQDTTSTTQADSLSVIGLKHAISLTYIINQALTEGDSLTGWLYVFRCQWDATLYLLGFILANPISPFTHDSQKSVTTASHTFTILEKYLSAVKSALDIINDVLGHCSTLKTQFRDALSPWNQTLPSNGSLSMAFSPPSPLGHTDHGPSYRSEDNHTIDTEITMPSLQHPLLSSTVRRPFQRSVSGTSGAALELSPSINQQSEASFSSSSEKRCGMFSTLDLDSVLESSPLLEDWQSLFSDFPAALEE